MKMTRKKLNSLCTLAKNNSELIKRDFVDVILIDAAFSAAFDEDNMWFLMQQDLLPIGTPSATFDNCNELIAWMESSETQEELCLKPVNGVKATIEFQGDIVEVSYYEPDIDKGFFYIRGSNIFFVSEVEDDGRFEVKCIHNECAWGGDYYLVLPKYVRDEFVATLKGEY